MSSRRKNPEDGAGAKRSYGLNALRALAPRKSPRGRPERPEPTGPVIWAHATSDARLAALRELGARLSAVRPGIFLLITRDSDLTHISEGCSVRGSDSYIETLGHEDTSAAAREFLAYWRPEMCLWTGGHLHPTLLAAADEAGIPLTLVDADENAFERQAPPFLPDPLRSAVRRFTTVMTASEAAASRLTRLGLHPARIRRAPPLRHGYSPPPCSEDELEATSSELAGRPAWMAVNPAPGELETVLNTHRNAVRFVHRLLLVIALDEPEQPGALYDMLNDAGLRYADWMPDDPIEETTQVIILTEPDTIDLWYRVAPVSLMGGTATADGGGGRSPFEPASLGSAVLHGPHVGPHLDAYSRLAAAKATELAETPEALGKALMKLVAPDEAATRALAAWEVVTEGAWLTDHLLELVQETLDARDADRADA